MEKYIELKNVVRKDIPRIINWLENDEVIDNWFGRYTYGTPAHLGYEPEKMLDANEDEWNEVFHDPHHEPHRSIFSIYLGQVYLIILIALIFNLLFIEWNFLFIREKFLLIYLIKHHL